VHDHQRLATGQTGRAAVRGRGQRLNISLDCLDPQRFRELTRTGDLAQVIKGIDAARKAGFATPSSTVVMKGRNDHEINDW
jgi:cyclic pyranopterin phosphate synthase